MSDSTNDLDARIRSALAAEDAAILDAVGELTIPQQIADSFRGARRWVTIAVFTETFAFTGLAIWCVGEFAGAGTTHSMGGWGLGALGSMAALLACKIWYWMDLNKTAVVREVKRLELQVAQLAHQPVGM